MVVPLVLIQFHRIFPHKPSSYWGSPHGHGTHVVESTPALMTAVSVPWVPQLVPAISSKTRQNVPEFPLVARGAPYCNTDSLEANESDLVMRNTQQIIKVPLRSTNVEYSECVCAHHIPQLC